MGARGFPSLISAGNANYFFNCSSALPISILLWPRPPHPGFPSLIYIYKQVPIFSFLRSWPCSLSSLLIFPLCFCFKCQGHL